VGKQSFSRARLSCEEVAPCHQREISVFLQGVDEILPGPAEGEAIFPSHVDMELTVLPIHC
jgi:hypothetical protein